jgi:2,3-bisphosphoglycerate-independent phosphoglycerate mutase
MARKPKGKGKHPMVVSRHGKYRFQTGMVTASLLRRGLSMAEAVDIARDVRDAVAGKSEIGTEKLSARIDSSIESRLGAEVAERMRAADDSDVVPMVETTRGTFPFSKGVVLRHLDTSGVELEEAMALVSGLERWARRQADTLTEEQVLDETASMLDKVHGHDVARRYRLTGWVRRSEKPVIILIGGATGTGKSTLAMELAYRLGVVWVTSTDMIRETMRSTLSPALVPGLHDHSFRGIVLGGQVLSDPRERVLAGFRGQTAQVAVGVRAVVRRALRENAHLIIEGTHLAPPFRQYLDPGDDAHVAGFVLAIPNEKEHSRRFPKRDNKQKGRRSSTYLDAFQSVRWIHDDLLRMAEETEALVLPNGKLHNTVTGAVDILSRELPVNEVPIEHPRITVPASGPDIPTLFLVLDGLADDPNPALDGCTPLQAASTPFIRRLAGSGGQGQIFTGANEGDTPSTDEGILALLGNPRDAKAVGRGLFEALGQGLPIPAGAVVLRGNLATMRGEDDIVDRRAGRIRAGVEDLLADLREVELSGGIVGHVFPSHEHRVVVMLQGPNLSGAVSDTDPGSESSIQRLNAPRPLDKSPEAGRTAEALHQLLAIARERLGEHAHNAARLAQGKPPANAIITRGAAFVPHRPEGEVGVAGAMVSGCSTALGVATYVGMQTASSTNMTGNLDTDLDAKFSTAAELLEDIDLVAIHIKGTDVAAHDRRPLEKRDFISAIDAALGRFLLSYPEISHGLRIVISADHGTSCVTGNHLAVPVPLLLATWQPDSEDEEDFDEESAAHGALGLLRRGELSELLGVSRGGEAPSLHP